MRIEKSGVRYFSLEELAASYGVQSVKKTNKEKLKEQQDKFLGYHKCPACKKPMKWLGGNVMTCCNEACKGLKYTKKNADGTESVWYSVAYDELNDKFSDYAKYLFEQKEN